MQKRALPSAAIDEALDRIRTEGCRAHGELGLDADALGAVLAKRFQARLDGLQIAADSSDAADLLARVDAAGLYLATACDLGSERGWDTLTQAYTPRLVGLAIRRGQAPSEAAELVEELMGALALPPPRGESRTRMATYLGAGTLFGWLATMLVRRIADRARARRTTSLEADPEAGESVRAGSEAEPLAAAVTRESATKVADAMSDAWARLSSRERLVLALKFRDGLTQRAAARILGVGEPRVSRLVGQVLAKLEAPIRAAVGSIEARQWPALRDAVRSRLATLAVELRPPAEASQSTGARHGS